MLNSVSEQDIKDALSAYFDESEILVQVQGQDFLVATPYVDKETSFSVKNTLNGIDGLAVTESSIIALAEMPYSVVLDGKTYDLTIARNGYIRTHLGTELGSVKSDTKFYIVFGDVVGIEGTQI